MSETLPFECDYEYACRIEPDYECANVNCELNQMHEGDCSTEAMKPKDRQKGLLDFWRLRYYDQHGEPHGLGVGLANPPAYIQATNFEAGKMVRYYADRKLEQRYQQLEQVAREMWLAGNTLIKGGYAHTAWFEYRDKIKDLGVSLDD